MYATRKNIESIFGCDNVASWADLDEDHDQIAINERIAKTLADAEVEVNDRLRDGPYRIPFEVAPIAVRRTVALLAGVLLCEAQGGIGGEDIVHQLNDKRKKIDDFLQSICTGTRKLTSRLT